MLIWHRYTHHFSMRTYTHVSGRKFSRIFNIGCSRRCAVNLTPLASSRLGRQFSGKIVLDIVTTQISDPCMEIKPDSPAHSPSWCVSSYYTSRPLNWGDASERSVNCLSAGIHQHLFTTILFKLFLQSFVRCLLWSAKAWLYWYICRPPAVLALSYWFNC